ncbi:hypothetical protein RHS02_09349, partial [Rhizoctonia solani]
MTVFGRRIALAEAVYAFVVLMSTATGQVAADKVECRYTERAKHDEWKNFGNRGKDVCQVAQELMHQTCRLQHMPTLDGNLPKENLWYTASVFLTNDSSSERMKECACDRVMFNILSACAGCYKWDWSYVNTTDIEWQRFETYQDGVCPNELKKKRVVAWVPSPPAWATSFNEDAFDPKSFNLDTITAPSSTFPDSATNSPSDTKAVISASPTSGDVQSASIASSGPPIGAIVGGVIGGLVLLGGIAGLAFWLHRRKRRDRDVAPSSEFLKPEYYTTPPLLTAHERRDSAYQDDMEDEVRPSPTNRHSWGGGLVMTRREEDDDDCEMLPPFTRGTYIGPSPHEKGHPERRDTGDTDITMRTNDTTTPLLPSSSLTRWSGPS